MDILMYFFLAFLMLSGYYRLYKEISQARHMKAAAEEYRILTHCLSSPMDTSAELDFWENEWASFSERYKGKIPVDIYNTYIKTLEHLLQKALDRGFTK